MANLARRKFMAMKIPKPTKSLQAGKRNPGEPKSYYEVEFQVGDKPGTATFYQTANGEFDLLYGAFEYTEFMHSTLEAALYDFRTHLQKNNPGAIITLGQPHSISKETAKKKSHLYKPSAF